MMATVPHVTSGLGLRKFQADGILLTRVYRKGNSRFSKDSPHSREPKNSLAPSQEPATTTTILSQINSLHAVPFHLKHALKLPVSKVRSFKCPFT